MYNKKLLVLALSAAFAAPAAYAQRGGGDKGGGEDADSVVVLYGKIYPEIEVKNSEITMATTARPTESFTPAMI